ncbi:MAG: phosphatase PAP2 family protein [Kofleriaceae bacterium]
MGTRMPRSWKLEALVIAGALNLMTGNARAQPDASDPAATSPTPPPAQAATTTATMPAVADTRAPPPLEVYDVRLAVDIPVIVLGATAGLLRTYLANHIVDKRCPCSTDDINSFDRRAVGNHSDAAALASDITVGLVLAAPPLLDLLVVGPNRAFAEDFIVLAETVMVSTLFQQVANFGFQRPRPRTYEGLAAQVHDGEGYLSFLAGHVATTTAVLSAASFTIRRRYGEHVWPWVVTGLVAASVGTERVLGGYHFPSDAALGAALGLGVGLAVPWLHARRPEMQLAVAPAPSGYGLALLGQF